MICIFAGGAYLEMLYHLLVLVNDHVTVGAVEPSFTFSCKVLSSQPCIPISCVSIHLLFQLSSPWWDGWVQQSCSYACLWSWIWLLVGGYRVRPLGKVTEQWMERDPQGLGQPFRTGENCLWCSDESYIKCKAVWQNFISHGSSFSWYCWSLERGLLTRSVWKMI